MSWLSIVLDRLRVGRCAVVGHSYGGWMALSFALNAPNRVSHLALVDPTSCFKGGSTRYNVRSVPMMMRPSAARCGPSSRGRRTTGRSIPVISTC